MKKIADLLQRAVHSNSFLNSSRKSCNKMEPIDPTSLIRETLKTLRTGFATKKTKTYNYRATLLREFKKAVLLHQNEIIDAIRSDLGRCEFLTRICEVDSLIGNIDYQLKNLKKFMQPKPCDIPLAIAPATGYVQSEPFGVALIMGSWNFPFATTLNPVICALAAGNCVCVKPSEISVNSSRVIKQMIDSLDPETLICLEGGPEIARGLLEDRWDVIAFTGSPEKGKLVAKAAAKYLTPTVLELGGKNPVIVDEDVDLEVAALRIVQARYLNLGQLCLSPEYVFIHHSMLNAFLEKVQKCIKTFFTDNPKESPDYGRIVNEFHMWRIMKLLDGHGGELITGGDGDIESKYISPTVILNPSPESELCKNEVFGPILSVFTYTSLDECIEYINAREKPLALYVFGNNQNNIDKVRLSTSSGHFSVNEAAFNYSCVDLPFGGVGESGMSMIFSKYGFEAMSHQKSVLVKSTLNMYPLTLRYPPYTPESSRSFNKIKFLNKYTVLQAARFGKRFLMLLVLIVVAYKLGWIKKLFSLKKLIKK